MAATKNANEVPVKYVGKKRHETDHLYGTGITWLRGQTKMVPVEVAPLLLNHPDVWRDARPAKEREAKPITPRAPEPKHVIEGELPLANLGAMTKAQLADYSMRYMGERLMPEAMTAAQMRVSIQNRMREVA